MEHALRDFARTKFAQALGPITSPIVKNAEKSVYNWAVQQTRCAGDEPSWENPIFRGRYKHKLHSLAMELRRPNHAVAVTTAVEGGQVRVTLDLVNQLAYRLRTKELEAKNLAKYTADVLWPDGPMAQAIFKLKERDLKREQAKAQMDEDYVGQFKCGKCKSVKTTYYQLQTRSADEPMVRFLVLLFTLCTATNSFYRQLTSPA